MLLNFRTPWAGKVRAEGTYDNITPEQQGGGDWGMTIHNLCQCKNERTPK